MNYYELSEEIAELFQRVRHGMVRVQQTDEHGEVTTEASGTLWTRAGIILTMSHAFDNPHRIRVIHGSDQPVPARVRGWDNRYNLAVIDVEGTTISPWQEWSELEALRPGELVLVLGYQEIRFGMVSRMVDEVVNRWGGVLKPWVEIDSVLSPAQAGGALLNSQGRFVGINSPVPDPVGQVIGYGQLQNLVQEILTQGNPSPSYLGVRTARAQTGDGKKGVVVTHVDNDSPAEQAGLTTGDVILGIAGTATAHPRALFMVLRTMKAGDTATLQINRSGKEQTLTATLGRQSE